MRVVSGTARGTVLSAPDGLQTRPTADRAKEALFSMIAPSVSGCAFLDLFCGSGAIGIEALSRGAASCCFVDNSAAAIQAVQKNLVKTKLDARAELLCAEAAEVVNRLSRRGVAFDIVFLDPPYGAALVQKTVDGLLSSDVLAKDGLCIAEQGAAEAVPVFHGLRLIKQKRYGAAAILVYEVDV